MAAVHAKPENKAKRYAYAKKRYAELKQIMRDCMTPCARCGAFDYRFMDFHHITPTDKDKNVSILTTRNCSTERLVKEIHKCECLCANCHRIHHFEERISNANL